MLVPKPFRMLWEGFPKLPKKGFLARGALLPLASVEAGRIVSAVRFLLGSLPLKCSTEDYCLIQWFASG